MKNRRFIELKKEIKYRINEARESFRNRHVKRTTAALFLALPYLVLEWCARAYGLYIIFPPVDIFIHFFFGIAFASIAFLIYEKKLRFILYSIFIVSIIWEIIEIIGDMFPAGAAIPDPFFNDGILDILFAMAGAVAALYCLKIYLKKHYFRSSKQD